MRKTKLFALFVAVALPFTLAACEDQVTDVEPSPNTGDIFGTVVAGNNQLVGVNVEISGPTSFTDVTRANGAYLFTDVPLGDYTVEISGVPEGVTCPTTSKAASVSTGGEATIVDFECESSSAQTALDRRAEASPAV